MTAAGHQAAETAVALAPLIAVHGVSRTYDDGAIVALSGVDIEVGAGEFVAISGPSGSGKSTLLHVLAGIDVPSAGAVFWKGVPVAPADWPALRRTAIGVVFQDFLLLPALTAIENVEIAMSGTGRGRAERRARASGLLAHVGLANRLRHLPHMLSGGERQRVAVARSIANDPEALLCDEPTGNLDSASAADVVELLLSLRRERGMALVVATHDQSLAARAERLVSLRDGRIVADVNRKDPAWA